MKHRRIEDLPLREQMSVRRMMCREFAAFFTAMMSSSNRGWPEISGQMLAETLADSLMVVGKQRGMGVGVLQTLVHELQDRINTELGN